MEEKIIVIAEDSLREVNEELQKGWKVKMIIPFCQPITMTGTYSSHREGKYGAYVVLERSLI